MEDLERRLGNAERDLGCELDDSPLKKLVDELRSLRGIDTVTAVSLLAEAGDLRRFPTAGTLMSYLGRRYRKMGERGKNTKTTAVAVARALAGYVWDIASKGMNQLQVASESSP